MLTPQEYVGALLKLMEERRGTQQVLRYVGPGRVLLEYELPLAEIRARGAERGLALPAIRAAVRSGDTTASERAAMLRRPPHLLVSTPESLYLLLTAERSRELLLVWPQKQNLLAQQQSPGTP